jgi:hypothetical protein
VVDLFKANVNLDSQSWLQVRNWLEHKEELLEVTGRQMEQEGRVPGL